MKPTKDQIFQTIGELKARRRSLSIELDEHLFRCRETRDKMTDMDTKIHSQWGLFYKLYGKRKSEKHD